MRPDVDAARVRALTKDLARHATGRVRLYLTGGATAVLVGWRPATIDVDIRLEPEDEGVLRRIPGAKEAVPVNVELASPPDFIPELPGWRDRSVYAFSEGTVDVYHFDPYSQALAKLARGLEQDLADVAAMRDHGLITTVKLAALHDGLEAELYRYPRIDPVAFRSRVEAFVAS